MEVGFRLFSADPYVWLGREVYPDNPRGYFAPCDEGFCVDGNRSVHGCEVPPEPGKTDVLLVGDSFAWGQGVRARDTFGALLRSEQIGVRNCARPGNSLSDVLQSADTHAQRHRPDALVYALVLNDIECGGPMNAVGAGLSPESQQDNSDLINDYINLRVLNLKAYVERRHADLGFLSWLMHSRVVSFYYRRWLMGEIAKQTETAYRECLAPGHRLDAQLDRVADLKSHADRVLVAIFPLFVSLDSYPFEAEHAHIAKGLRDRGLDVIDLLDTYRGADADALVVHRTDLHPNDVAHRMAKAPIDNWLSATR